MTAENKKEDKTKSGGSGLMGSDMFEMMKECCAGEGSFSCCTPMMKSMMERMKSRPFCGPKTKDAEEGEK